MVRLSEKLEAKDDLNNYYSWRCFKKIIGLNSKVAKLDACVVKML